MAPCVSSGLVLAAAPVGASNRRRALWRTSPMGLDLVRDQLLLSGVRLVPATSHSSGLAGRGVRVLGGAFVRRNAPMRPSLDFVGGPTEAATPPRSSHREKSHAPTGTVRDPRPWQWSGRQAPGLAYGAIRAPDCGRRAAVDRGPVPTSPACPARMRFGAQESRIWCISRVIRHGTDSGLTLI
jgi:hypothetical protein